MSARLCPCGCRRPVPAPTGRGRPATYASPECRRSVEYAAARHRRGKARITREWETAAAAVTEREWLASDAWARMAAGYPVAARSPVMALRLRDPERFIGELLFWHGPAIDDDEGFWEAEDRLLRFATAAYEAATGPWWTLYAPGDIQAAVRDRAANFLADMIRLRDPGKTQQKLRGRLNEAPRGWVPGGDLDREDGTGLAAPPRPSLTGGYDRETTMNAADIKGAGMSVWSKGERRKARAEDFTSTDAQLRNFSGTQPIEPT